MELVSASGRVLLYPPAYWPVSDYIQAQRMQMTGLTLACRCSNILLIISFLGKVARYQRLNPKSYNVSKYYP